MKTALEIHEEARDERQLRERVAYFCEKYAPADKQDAAEFQADLMMVVQAVHRDAMRCTHELLKHALAVMPNPPMVWRDLRPKPEDKP